MTEAAAPRKETWGARFGGRERRERAAALVSRPSKAAAHLGGSARGAVAGASLSPASTVQSNRSGGAGGAGRDTSTSPMVPPVSKSDAHRALVLAELCGGRHEALLPAPALRARDVGVLSRGLVALRAEGGALDCLDAGAPFRFLVTQAALRAPHAWRFFGTPRLAERPQHALFDALARALGTTFERGAAPWPLTVRSPGGRAPTSFTVEAGASSQFASSLMLGAAALVRAGAAPVTVALDGALASAGYFALTVGWLRRFGFAVHEGEGRFTVQASGPGAPPEGLPGDWSSLTYLLPLSWCSGVPVASVDLASPHPDARFAAHLSSVGLALSVSGGVATVHGEPRRGLSVDASACPDAVPALVALALRCPAPSVFTHCAVLRLKESDRLEGTAALAEAFGGRATVTGDQLVVEPPGRARGATYDGRDDHRLVMAAATAARLLGVPVRLRGTAAVEKSFPGFWDEAAKAGVERQEAP
ncbi:MAG: 3-phosphoshikimate 1-carboxyvinyltransferase [Myxococcaceae bacterium]|nr:3-phosphoshikimate 1-carboxyvinyltransferase [Myxococcaceae bacterium]MCA3016256.1 3-phosphoshikimate 1-carboxyvinyltransferase [Myxococcaceae bacterium]